MRCGRGRLCPRRCPARCARDIFSGSRSRLWRSGRCARRLPRPGTSNGPEIRSRDGGRRSFPGFGRTSRAWRRYRRLRPGSARCGKGPCTNIARRGGRTMYVADTKRLTAAGAKKMMATAIGRAQEAGIAVTVAIADAGGHLVLLERMEGGRFHTVHSATTKAVCAASNKRITGPKGAQGQSLDVTHAVGLALAAGPERWTAMEGGGPIIVGGECIGGVGVAGGRWGVDERP